MPIDDFLKTYQPGEDFSFDAFRAAAVEEAEKDRAAANAAISTRDAELAEAKAQLTKAQAAAWELYNNAPEGDADKQQVSEPDENSMEAIRARVFKPLNR